MGRTVLQKQLFPAYKKAQGGAAWGRGQDGSERRLWEGLLGEDYGSGEIRGVGPASLRRHN